MRRRRAPWVAAAVGAFAVATLSAGKAWGPDFTIVSQNCLHLGQGRIPAYIANKNAYLSGYVMTGMDAVLLQEVMDESGLNDVTPGNYSAYQGDLEGRGSYQERYRFLLRDAKLIVHQVGGHSLIYYNDAADEFMRPPWGIVAQTVDTNAVTWLVDFHAIWGKRSADRKAEAAALANVRAGFAGTAIDGAGTRTDRIVIAGDFNLRAADPDLAGVFGAAHTNVEPVGPTSLKRNGSFSKPYDHFLWRDPDVNVHGTAVLGALHGLTDQQYYTQISDHRGVSARVDY